MQQVHVSQMRTPVGVSTNESHYASFKSVSVQCFMVTDQDLAREKRRDPQMGRKKSMSVFYGEGCRYRNAEDFYVF